MRPTLPKDLEKRPFTLREALKSGLTRRALQSLEKHGQIEKIDWGTYQATSDDMSEFRELQNALAIIEKPSAICLLSALNYYGLTDAIPKKVWVLVPNSKRKSSKGIRLVRSRNPQWKLGIQKEDDILITSPERTLIDSFIYHRLLGKSEAVMALKKAIQLKKTTSNKIWDLAKKMKVEKRILPYLEMLI